MITCLIKIMMLLFNLYCCRAGEGNETARALLIALRTQSRIVQPCDHESLINPCNCTLQINHLSCGMLHLDEEIGEVMPENAMQHHSLCSNRYLDMMEDAITELEDDDEPPKPPKKRRRRNPHRINGDYSGSPWFKSFMNIPLDHELNVNPDSAACKRFKARFRVPWRMFVDKLLPWTKAKFPQKNDAVGIPGIPTELKLLAVLRVMGRAETFDTVSELTDCGFNGEALRVFYHKWVSEFASEMYPLWVKLPSTEEEISNAMAPYKTAGLNGAIGSVDVTHVKWDRCGHSHLNRTSGKEGRLRVLIEHTRCLAILF